MPLRNLYITLACIVLAMIHPVFSWRQRSQRRISLPPGPRPLFVLGNIFQIPDLRNWIACQILAKAFGPIVYYELFGKPAILISSHEVSTELLERHGDNYADRSKNTVMGGELVGWDRSVGLQAAGPRHTYYRKLLNTMLNPTEVRKLQPLQERSAARLLLRLLEDPEHWYTHIRPSISEALVHMCYGQDFPLEEFPYIDMAERAWWVFNNVATANSFAVDFLPILKYLPEWFPGAGFKRQARVWRAELDKLGYGSLEIVKDHVRKGIAGHSYVSSLIKARSPLSQDDEDAICWTAIGVFTGGVDTTAAAVTTFIMVMSRYPDVQRRAYDEIRDTIGTDRLPTLNDRPRLPYITACILEMFRMFPIVPLGVSKLASNDDWYDGYFIPAGATIVSNIWAMSHDPNIYEDPDTFEPERFLQCNPSCDADKSGFRSTRVFGHGRRICPGRHLGESMVFIQIATIVAAFGISAPRNSDGESAVDYEFDFVDGLIVFPKPFECTITPRSQNLAMLLG